MADKQPMQADGRDAATDTGQDEAARGAGGSIGAGESGGGSRTNQGATADAPTGGFTGHGGQTNIDYHGPEQLGDEPEGGADNPNGVAAEE